MSYRKKHIKSRINKIKPKRSILTRLWFWVLILILVVIFFGSYFVLFYSGFQVKDSNIIVFGNERVSTQEIKSLALKYSNTGLVNFWNIKVTSDSIFLIDKDRISTDILEKFPEIGKLTINKKLPQALLLGIEERKPVGVFCDDKNKCFLVDVNGVAFGPQVNLPTDVTIVRQSAETSLVRGDIFAGEKVIEQKIVDNIYKVQKNLKDNFQIDLKEALVTSPIRLNVKTKENWQIYFDLSSGADINSQLTKLDLLLDGGMSANQMENLRYIDLRPKDRAIICDNAVCAK